ncbi:MAG: hypothetical protein H6942_14890 [Candidatus Accumulibacter sp.]|uniref:hypothetical protein n=1 Tax=Accumulibacter sp. TaxID=2053492 RepID=UPI001A007E45|nr:hypothetical protein [Accumulibacter sp.]MBE2259250.1 hypothetical protein [Paracoccaceae bacterium]MCB1941040.1 hypothetical protein [Accumulibacter sp.]MCP5249797.1 hypothetical protein [Accumulibacter sp.]
MSTTQSERTRQRRRLLKNAAAVPAIFVLPTGAALANTSANACVEKGLRLNNFQPIPRVTDQPDQWVRQPKAGAQQGDKTTYEIVRLDNDTPVAGASCWNSIHPHGPKAGAGNLLIP